jgi:hypothetical protein
VEFDGLPAVGTVLLGGRRELGEQVLPELGDLARARVVRRRHDRHAVARG